MTPTQYSKVYKQRPTGETGVCEQCGSTYPRKNGDRPNRRFCNFICANRWKAHHTNEARALKLRGRGQGKSYPKLFGRHAHRVVAEQMLSRPLVKGEIVHHKNENRLDYSEDNLEVLPSQSAHIKLHYPHRVSKYKGTSCGECGRPWTKYSGFARGCCHICYQRLWKLGAWA